MGLNLTKNNVAEKSEVGYEFELKTPSGENSGAFITVRGDESKAVRDYDRKKFNAYQARVSMAKKRGKDLEDFSIEEYEDIAVEDAAVRVISWKGLEEGEGKAVAELPCTPENIQRVMRQHKFIRDQVREEASQLLNFLKS